MVIKLTQLVDSRTARDRDQATRLADKRGLLAQASPTRFIFLVSCLEIRCKKGQ
jgi:hypothetical protein